MRGSILAIDLMGRRAEWNHPAIFPYTERYVAKRGVGVGFVAEMWSLYKRPADGSPTAPQGLKIMR
jgi:hypothetical protein